MPATLLHIFVCSTYIKRLIRKFIYYLIKKLCLLKIIKYWPNGKQNKWYWNQTYNEADNYCMAGDISSDIPTEIAPLSSIIVSQLLALPLILWI